MIRDSAFVTKISGDAGLRNTQEIVGQLKGALASHSAVTIALSEMTGADITTVQLLLAARRQALAHGKTLTLAAPPQGPLRELLIQIGIFDATGKSATSDADFWIPDTQQTRGKAA